MSYQSSFMIRYRIPYQAIHPLTLGKLFRALRRDFNIMAMGRGHFTVYGFYVVAVLHVSIDWCEDGFFLVNTIDELYKDAVLWVPGKHCQVGVVNIDEPADTTYGVPYIRVRKRWGNIIGRIAVSVDPQLTVYEPLRELQKFLLILAKHGLSYEYDLLRSM